MALGLLPLDPGACSGTSLGSARSQTLREYASWLPSLSGWMLILALGGGAAGGGRSRDPLDLGDGPKTSQSELGLLPTRRLSSDSGRKTREGCSLSGGQGGQGKSRRKS